MPDIYAELKWRGLLHQVTDPEVLPGWLNAASRVVYAGFDPTADSLHVGSLLPLLLLRRFQHAGHRPVAVIGGSTGMIGDPSGKSAERNLLSTEQLSHNVACLTEQLRHFLDFGGGSNSALLVNNFDWMSQFGMLDFLRHVGKHFPINVMLSKDSVKGRVERDEDGLSYTEFSYMLLQAYDFVHLFRELDCRLQVGGSDQWGNITTGIDLARRMDGVQLYGITCPLLAKNDGTKMGKTESGAVWLSAERTSPYEFYQYWINVEDEDAGQCLRFLTELDQDTISQLDLSRQQEPHRRESQRALAEALTEMVHGGSGLSVARRATEVLFGAEICDLSDAQLAEVFIDVPSQELPPAALAGDGLNLIDALVQTGLSRSKAEARRTVQQGGAYVNNRRREDLETRLTRDDLASETVMVLRSGKKKYALLRFVD